MNDSYTYIQVDANDNTPMSASQVYKNLGMPFPVKAVLIYEGEPQGTPYEVVGWSSLMGGVPSIAYAVQIEDSSEGSAYVVYGADCGIRLRPLGSDAEWSLDNTDQLGETHLVLASLDELTPA
jgi:hypothetical protein